MFSRSARGDTLVDIESTFTGRESAIRVMAVRLIIKIVRVIVKVVKIVV
jgi:hypothetical protein